MRRSVIMNEAIGERLERVRKRQGLSQHDFSSALGISRSSLLNYVRGDRDIPTSILAKLLELYSVDPSWMVQGDASDATFRQKSDILAQIRQISMAVERRAAERAIPLTPEERWQLTSQLYTLAIVQEDAADIDSAKGNFALDQVFANNGF